MRLLLLLLALLLPVNGVARTLTGNTVWRDRVEVTDKVRVERGAELTVAAGSQVIFNGGSLEVAGRLVATQASFDGKGWPGIVLKGCDATTVLFGVTVSGAETGVQVIGGAPQIRNSRFSGNRVGVELRQKTAAIVTNNLFSDNDKVGLFVKDGTTATVVGNSFSGNGQYAAYIYRATPQQFSGNRFENNATGLMVSFAGSEPLLQGNRFSGNQTGIRVERAARPQIVGNRIDGNRIGIDLYRRADPEIRGNRIEHNDKGVKIAFSSYPLITGNDFSGNGRALFLEFQSSTWEGTQGGVERASETARRSAFGGQNKNVVVATPPPYLDGSVHAPENWWGESGTRELERLGAQGNPEFLDDGRDRPTFVDGGKTYPLDRVAFTPWQTAPCTTKEESQ